MSAVSSASDAQSNFAISPLSASLNLAMLANGAEGETYTQIVNGLGYRDFNIDDVNNLSKKLAHNLSDLNSDDVQLQIANSLWVREGRNIDPQFVANMNEYFNAESFSFDTSNFAQRVNNWISDKTHGTINAMDANSKYSHCAYALLNASYYKAKWDNGYAFDASETKPGNFKNYDGSTSLTAFMRSESQTYKYSDINGIAAISIPMAEGNFTFTIVLPSEDMNMKECAQWLADGGWDTLCENARDEATSIKMPKFRIKSENNFKNALISLGMERIFTYDAQLQKMGCSPNCAVEAVAQSINFEIDENGAVASASTGTYVGDTIAPLGPLFVIDRPFFYVVSENSTKSILFVGQQVKF